MEKKTRKKLLGFYDYTVILTYCGMLLAVLGIFFILSDRFRPSAICLMLAGVCDMFDGAVAATKSRTFAEKCFGIQIDSLSDLISFGVLPALFVFCFLKRHVIAGVISAFYILCALIRLAYFNVLEEARQRRTTRHRTTYLGVPVTTIALLLPAVFLLCQVGLPAAVLPALLGLLAIGFLLPVNIRKPALAGKVALVLAGVLLLILLLWGGNLP